MKLKRIITSICAGALAVSCLALATGCSSDSGIKDAFMNQKIITEPNGYGLCEPTPYELDSFEVFDGTKDNGKIDGQSVKAVIKNNIGKQEVWATINENNGEYTFSDYVTHPLEVYSGVTEDKSLDGLDPDFNAATIDDKFYCNVPIKSPWYSSGESSSYMRYDYIAGDISGSRVVLCTWCPVSDSVLADNANTDNIVGTYTATSDCDIKSVTIADTGKTQDDMKIYSITYEVPSPYTLTDLSGIKNAPNNPKYKEGSVNLTFDTATITAEYAVSADTESIKIKPINQYDHVNGSCSLVGSDQVLDEYTIYTDINFSEDEPAMTLGSKVSYEVNSAKKSLFGSGYTVFEHTFDFKTADKYVKN